MHATMILAVMKHQTGLRMTLRIIIRINDDLLINICNTHRIH